MMSSKQADLQQLNAFVDGELDLERQLEIEALVAANGSVRAQVERLRSLRDAVRSGAEYHRAPAALRDRVRSVARIQPAAARHAQSAWQRWFAWRPLVSAAALVSVLAVASNLWLLQDQHQDQLEQEVVASHVRATLGQREIDLRSSDHHQLRPWLSARLDFSPPVQELDLPDSALVGGRIDYLDGRPVATLVYQHAGHTVDAFIWPSSRNAPRPTMTSRRGFNIGHWSRGGMEHWVISDLNAQEFAELVRALSQAD